VTGHIVKELTVLFFFGHPKTRYKGPEGEERYSSTLSLTSTLDMSGWSMPCPGRSTPGKETQYPLYRRLGGPQGQSGWVQKIWPPPGFDPQTTQKKQLENLNCGLRID